jgi:hypothetical protein
MSFEEIKIYNPKALYALQEVQPLEFAIRSPIRRLDYLIGFIKKSKPEIVKKFIKNLKEKYEEKSEISYVKKDDFDIAEILLDFSNLKEFSDLAMKSLNYFLNLLEIDDRFDWIKKKTKVPQRNYLRSFLGPKYINVESLSEIIEREEAIKLYKRYITEYIIDYDKDREENVDNLDSLWERYFQNYEVGELDHWVVIHSKPKNGKMIYRKDTCLWDDAMDGFSDKELKYLVCCYGDFQGAKRENRYFVLTMDYAIAKGDPYCSCVIHDTRMDWNLSHPPKEYWDNIWPLQEWQKE